MGVRLAAGQLYRHRRGAPLATAEGVAQIVASILQAATFTI
jgi:hypothetical protein